MLTGIGELLVKWTMTLSLTFTRMTGPGTIPLKVMEVATTPVFKSVGTSIATKKVSKIFGSGFTSSASGRLPCPPSSAMSGVSFRVRKGVKIRNSTRTTAGDRYAERRERIHRIGVLHRGQCRRIGAGRLSLKQPLLVGQTIRLHFAEVTNCGTPGASCNGHLLIVKRERTVKEGLQS